MSKTTLEVYDYNTATWKPRVSERNYRKVPVEATLDFLPWAEASVHPSSGELGVITINPPITRIESNPLFSYREVEEAHFPPMGNHNTIYSDHFGTPNLLEQIEARKALGWKVTPALEQALARVAALKK